MPKVGVAARAVHEASVPVLILPWLEEGGLPEALRPLDESVGGAIAAALEKRDLKGATDELFYLYGPRKGGPERLLFCGLGKRSGLTLERFRSAAGVGVKRARALRASAVAVWFPAPWLEGTELVPEHVAQALVEGAILGAWRFDELKTVFEGEGRPPEIESISLLSSPGGELKPLRAGAHAGWILAESQNRARNWVNRPGNVLTPSTLAEEAKGLAREHKLKATILDRAAIEKEKMGALLAVARGSEEEPRLIVLEYAGGKGAPLALVGKGVTFDSGGLSLKPADNMETMKYDMSGAAAVLGAMDAIARLGLDVNVVAVVPATENLPSGRATKPGDVIRSYAGKTIEVLNTDAEGRLILADALAYAVATFKPGAIVDAATLTGAVVVALGHHAIGLMSPSDALADELVAAGRRSGEAVWRLPLWDPYREQLKSEVADLKNVGGRSAGTITAGWFLREFVGETPWAHLDIAGTAWAESERPYQPKAGTGVGVRLFTEWVRARA